jgi:hypothetical protein
MSRPFGRTYRFSLSFGMDLRMSGPSARFHDADNRLTEPVQLVPGHVAAVHRAVVAAVSFVPVCQ